MWRIPFLKRLLLWVPVVILITGCAGDVSQKVTFYTGEGWDTEISMTIDLELLTFSSSPQEFEATLDQLVAEAELEGVDGSWSSSRNEEEGTITYEIFFSGEGLDLLRQTVFENSASIEIQEVDGQRQIFISYVPGINVSGLSRYELTLEGGEVISHNGQQVEDGVVRWLNPPGRIQAVLTEKSRYSFGGILLSIVAIGLLGGGGWYVYQKRNQQQATAYCVNCGTALAPGARFCPKCGHQQ